MIKDVRERLKRWCFQKNFKKFGPPRKRREARPVMRLSASEVFEIYQNPQVNELRQVLVNAAECLRQPKEAFQVAQWNHPFLREIGGYEKNQPPPKQRSAHTRKRRKALRRTPRLTAGNGMRKHYAVVRKLRHRLSACGVLLMPPLPLGPKKGCSYHTLRKSFSKRQRRL